MNINRNESYIEFDLSNKGIFCQLEYNQLVSCEYQTTFYYLFQLSRNHIQFLSKILLKTIKEIN